MALRWRLWALAILLFGLGDVVTTHLGLSVVGTAEGRQIIEGSPNPLVQQIAVGGTEGILLWKIAVIGAFFIAYLFADEEYRVGIPIGLALLGGVIVAWNLNLIF